MPRRRASENNPAGPADATGGGDLGSRPGRFSYEGLDRVLHEKARLGILASLAGNVSGLLFNDLKRLCSLTDGNLNRHLAVLTDAGLVEVWKGATGPRPQTMYRLTAGGRRRFAEYINVLEKVVADAQADALPAPRQQRLPGALVARVTAESKFLFLCKLCIAKYVSRPNRRDAAGRPVGFDYSNPALRNVIFKRIGDH